MEISHFMHETKQPKLEMVVCLLYISAKQKPHKLGLISIPQNHFTAYSIPGNRKTILHETTQNISDTTFCLGGRVFLSDPHLIRPHEVFGVRPFQDNML